MIEEKFRDWVNLLVDPTNKSKLSANANLTFLKSEIPNISNIAYPINDGIIDLLPEEFDSVSLKYDGYSPKYDPWIRGSNFFLKLFKRVAWGIKDEFDYTNKVMASIPDNFQGILVDVPVGTGIFTVDKYKRLTNAKIFCLDYSLEMLKLAKRRFETAGIENVIFLRGNVCNLPFDDKTVDLLVCMSGLEVFIEKDSAIYEMSRIVKISGKFVGCTYVKGVLKIKDYFSRLSVKRTGLVTPPFYTEAEWKKKIEQYFQIKHHSVTKSIWNFDAYKP